MNIPMWISIVVAVIGISVWFPIRKERRFMKATELSAKDALELSKTINSNVKKIEKKLFYAIKDAALEGRTYVISSVDETNVKKLDLILSHLEERGYKAKYFYDAELDKHVFNIEWNK